MTEEAILMEETSIRQKYPEVFLHSDLRPGEMLLGLVSRDRAIASVNYYNDMGIPTVRVGNANNGQLQPVFVNLREYARLRVRRRENAKHGRRRSPA